MATYLKDKIVTVSAYYPYQINNSIRLSAIASEEIIFGDTVYIIDNNVYLAPNGDFYHLPKGTIIGFTTNTAKVGEEVFIRTLGEVDVELDMTEELLVQDALIAQINAVLEGEV